MRIALTIFCFLVFPVACSYEKVPKVGPDGSWWLGGADGGVFVKIEEDGSPSDRFFIGTIYYDSDQSIWYQGAFKLVGDIDFSPENRDQYLAWDGEYLHLIESSYLEAKGDFPSDTHQ